MHIRKTEITHTLERSGARCENTKRTLKIEHPRFEMCIELYRSSEGFYVSFSSTRHLGR